MWGLQLGKRATTPIPAPISIAPTQKFEGNDGPWSTFPIQIGTPPQMVNILPSTASSQTWAILSQGCTNTDPANCTTSRGGAFQPNSSTTWNQNPATANGLFPLLLDNNLGYSGAGYYGYDTVVLGGEGGPSLTQQAVAGIATKEFYLGLFGLSPQETTLPDSTRPLPDYISQLNTSAVIPSLSWSYTAGNQYRPGPVYGSLILGGYDSSRFEPNDISFPIDQSSQGVLTAYIADIILSTAGNTTALQAPNNSIAVSIDSSTPFIWLPLYACQQFEKAFGITWDSNASAYLVNDTLHNALQNQDTSVVFSLTNSSSATEPSLNISLPYAAFDLIAEPPLAPKATRYFPLMRAANESQFTFGRTFLQEAYLTADYERNNFSISQCTYPQNPQPHIIPIRTLAASPPPPSHHLSGGAIAGIVIGILAFFALLLGLATYLLLKRRRSNKQSPQPPPPTEPKAAELESPHTTDGYPWTSMDKDKRTSRFVELDTVEHKGHEIDGNISPRALEQEQQQHQVHELDSPPMKERSGMTALHKRTFSDPSSIGSEGSAGVSPSEGTKTNNEGERGLGSEESAVSPTKSELSPNASGGHKRGLSDPVSL